MTGRDGAGKFTTGNPWASSGGRARAARLSPQERRGLPGQALRPLWRGVSGAIGRRLVMLG